MIFDMTVLFLALFLLWIDRLVVWFEDTRENVRRCFQLGLDRAWGWIVGRELCPCSLVVRAIYGQPAPLGWLPREWRNELSGLASDTCMAIEDWKNEVSCG